MARNERPTFKSERDDQGHHHRSQGRQKEGGQREFYLDLFNLSSNALFTKNRGVGTILNDD